ncbi:MAG: glutaredoxin 3 [Legionellales bacterium RIFCSPHIGHO2_12_FULL_42_9]|nr:MAG: glutaredoxin 3 [Legionellales bacterium RIFCSPHIGHO2_12_FULL_42_9]
MANVIIYTTEFCSYCVTAKKLLEKKGVQYSEIRLDTDPAQRDKMIKKTNRYTVPQIFINDTHVGGCDDLYALERSGQLDKLLNS